MINLSHGGYHDVLDGIHSKSAVTIVHGVKNHFLMLCWGGGCGLRIDKFLGAVLNEKMLVNNFPHHAIGGVSSTLFLGQL